MPLARAPCYGPPGHRPALPDSTCALLARTHAHAVARKGKNSKWQDNICFNEEGPTRRSPGRVAASARTRHAQHHPARLGARRARRRGGILPQRFQGGEPEHQPTHNESEHNILGELANVNEREANDGVERHLRYRSVPSATCHTPANATPWAA